MEQSGKAVSRSLTEHVQIIMPAHCNGFGRLFGGRLMEWIDVTAAVCARRHSESNVVTVCVDGLDFAAPAFVDQTVVLSACVTYVGTTSMEVRVESFVEDVHSKRTLINRAYLVLVALDQAGRPKGVPALVCESAADKAEHDAALVRAELRKRRRNPEV
jgi:acyl-CoA hydrolase